MLLRLSRYDSSLIASEYGLDFPAEGPSPDNDSIRLAQAISAAVPQSNLPELLPKVGHALWRNDRAELESLAAVTGEASADIIDSSLNAGTELRAKLSHYSGAMFHYEGEWYWGIDRLHYLEERLQALGASRSSGALLAPCPAVSVLDVSNASALTLEFFPSLRSPYTSIVFDETVALAESTGVNFVIRPVLPMVMRGVPATFEKGLYIFSDTAREARRRGVPYGRFHDPIGNPVRRCYAIYPWAERQGRGAHLLSSFLKHAFAMGVNTDTDRGLKRVVEAAGLDWHAAKTHLGESEWQDMLEGNRLSMYEGGLWGVPSYRLIDADGNVHLEIWGQDRLWLVAREIRRLHKAQ
jgi:2-hydroxychromene-2-carboxylate isomerase